MGTIEDAGKAFDWIQNARLEGTVDMGKVITELSNKFQEAYTRAINSLKGAKGTIDSLIGKIGMGGKGNPEMVKNALALGISQAVSQWWLEGAARAESMILWAIIALNKWTPDAISTYVAERAKNPTANITQRAPTETTDQSAQLSCGKGDAIIVPFHTQGTKYEKGCPKS